MGKQIISMNVDSKVYSKYSEVCKEKGLIMSKQIENFMKRFLEKEE
jgi:antitoxin component of RelBE/YafQ-DinJ toxin-antitoxin module